MRIALVIEQMDPSRGGREVSTAQIALGLARRRQDVTILCQRADWRGEGVEVEELGRRGLTRSGRFLSFSADVQAYVKEHPFDAVHAVAPVLGATVYQPRGGTFPGRAAAGRLRGPLVAFRQRVLGPLNRHRAAQAERERQLVADPRVTCLAVSEMVAREFAAHFGRRENVRVVYNGVDVPEASPDQRAAWRAQRRRAIDAGEEDVVFLTIANNFSLKGVEEAMGLFLRWCDRRGAAAGRARLVVVGKGLVTVPHRSRRVREVQDRIRMVPWTPDIFEWYSAADACVLLSWYDACSRVVLEATRWGLPSITTRLNGAAEVLAEGGGLVVDSPRDAEGVLRAMDALADPAQRAERSRACLRAAPRLSMDRHVEELLAVYAAAGGNS